MYYQSLKHSQNFYQGQLTKIYEFLAPLHGIWSEEVLNNYPETLKCYPSDWTEAMAALSMQEQWQIEQGLIPEHLKDTPLGNLFHTLAELEDLPSWNFSLGEPTLKSPKDYPGWALSHVTQKKQHEVIHFATMIEQAVQSNKKFKILDIGGGKGHLSRFLALYHGHNATTIDTNGELQELGLQRLEKYPHPEGAGTLTFLNHTFGPQTENQVLDEKLFDESDVTLGLHTCGPLALEHLKTYRKDQSLFNFGCCYQKLVPNSDTNLAQFTKDNTPLQLTKYALTLATRGHTKISFEDYQLKKQVKLYRAALHFWMSEKTEHHTFITVGSAKARDYFQDFGHYAQRKLAQFNIYEEVETLTQYYQSEETQKRLQEIHLANLIRWRFGRIIEKFILVDRALWQIEKGHHAKLYQVFDATLSPRNTVLYISKD